MRRTPRARVILNALPEEVVAGFEDALAELVLAAADSEDDQPQRERHESGDLRPVLKRSAD